MKKSRPTVKIYINVPESNSWSSWGSQTQGFALSLLCYWGRTSVCLCLSDWLWVDTREEQMFLILLNAAVHILRAELLIWGQLKFRVYKRHDSFLISCLSAKERSSQWVNPAKRHICNQTQRERDKEKTFFLFMTGHSKRKMHKVIRYKPKDPLSWFYVSLQRWNSFR